jgi:hypothetical protein
LAVWRLTTSSPQAHRISTSPSSTRRTSVSTHLPNG